MKADPTSRGPRRLVALAALGCLVTAAALGAGDTTGGDAAAHDLNGRAGAAAATDVASNWAGYVATGLDSTAVSPGTTTVFRNATATWRQRAGVCPAGSRAASSIWVGLGGYSETSMAIEQTGTSADCRSGGKPLYYAWWELYPEPSVTIKSMKIAPGDLITASVLVTGNEVLMQVKNRTRKSVFTKRVTVARPDLSSAEWIAEAPLECFSDGNCRSVPLANFGSVTFTKVAALATIPGLGDQGGTISSPLWRAVPIRLVPVASGRYFGDVDDAPGSSGSTAGARSLGLSADGSSFRVKWVPNAAGPGG
jgi:hypothetical protein